MLGIGGGGDVVGALAVARHLEGHGVEPVLGGVAWERRPIDPHPGPRGVSEIVDAQPLADHVLRCGPQTRTADGAVFAEAHMARFLAADTLLVDILDGPSAVAGGLGSVAAKLGADLVVCVDVGGDVLGTGAEPGLASPLCDAVMLAAAAELQRTGTRTVAAVFGPCCDGELTVEELLERLAALGRAGALLGTSSLAGAVADELERAIAQVPTEASAQALRCARGEVGWTTIRAGRRKVFMSPLGALSFYFDPMRAMEEAAPLARAVRGAHSLDQANEALHAAGVRTELDYERSAVEA